jgi:dipeptidyl-peptidase-4
MITSARSPLSLALVLALILTWCSLADARGDSRLPTLDFDLLFGDNATGRRPTALKWSPKGDRLGFFYEDGDGKALWTWDSVTGATELRARQEVNEIEKLDAFHWSPDGQGILLESGGDLALIRFDAEGMIKLTTTEADEENPKFSPAGDRIAFARDNDLWLMDLETKREHRLTQDGAEGLILNGKTDWVYWEEIWGRKHTGHWWSPDGSKIAYYRFDETRVREYPLVDFTQQYPEITPQRYPKAGEVNPTVQVGVLDLDTGITRWLISNSEDDSYPGRVDWLPDGSAVAIQRLNRDQNRLELLRCPLDDGPCELLLDETSKTWVNLSEDLRFLADGRFLWTTETSGWRRLWLHDSDGSPIRELTPAGWTTEHIDELVPGSDSAVWTGYKTDTLGALHRTVFAQSLSGAAPVALASSATASATVSRNSGHAAILESRSDVPFSAYVVASSGKRIGELPVAAPEEYDPEDLPQWEFLTIPGPDGIRLPAALLEPEGAVSGTKHPVIQYHYGGPASQVVTDRWGTPDRLHRRFGEVNLAAQKAGVEYLRSLSWVDPERIGLWGWSGGGSNTLYSILNSPGTWRAGVSGAPVTDWHFYDTIWTERYLDHPEDNCKGYEQSSALTHAAKLEDALLLVHGTADDNVHPQNTFAMAARLVAAQKHFELAIHPRQKHGFRDQDSRHFYERMTQFFDRELGS